MSSRGKKVKARNARRESLKAEWAGVTASFNNWASEKLNEIQCKQPAERTAADEQ